MWGLPGVLALALALGVATAASAGSLYRWETEDGALAFTDDARRIPPRYRARAQAERWSELERTARITPTDAKATGRYAERLERRLAHLRQLNAALEREHASARPAASAAGVRLRVGGREGAVVEVEPEVAGDSAPIVVEERRYRPEGTPATRVNTVVRQGDRVIAVVRPLGHVVRRFPDESELER